MLYCEFLEGTGTTENAYTYAEYKRVEGIYNANENMTKADAYAMYREPDELTVALLNEISSLRTKNADLRLENKSQSKKIEDLEFELRFRRDYLKDLKRDLDNALYTIEDKFGI